jgi:hypothetical protein
MTIENCNAKILNTLTLKRAGKCKKLLTYDFNSQLFCNFAAAKQQIKVKSNSQN